MMCHFIYGFKNLWYIIEITIKAVRLTKEVKFEFYQKLKIPSVSNWFVKGNPDFAGPVFINEQIRSQPMKKDAVCNPNPWNDHLSK